MAQGRLSVKVKQDLKEIWNKIMRSGGIGGYREDALPSFDFGEQISADSDGIISSGRCKISVDPSNNDTITIGGHVFKFLTTLVAANTYTQVKRGTSLAVTLAALVDAINGVTNAAVVVATTPFTLAVYADAVDSTHLRIRQSSAQGVSALEALAPASVTLASSLTTSGDVWQATNMNVTGQSASSSQRRVLGKVTITAEMITYGKLEIDLPFTASRLLWDGVSSSFVKRAVNEAVTYNGASIITLTLAGGASPNWQAGDLFTFLASE